MYRFLVNKKELNSDFQFGNIKSDYGVNSLYWTKNSNAFLPICGEFHFSRYNNSEWKRELLKMKAGGIDFVSTYIFWNHHEYKKGEYNFKDDMDIHKFLSICKQVDMPCILRIGPWVHGECLYGGFPKYIQRLSGKRHNNKTYLKYVREFWTKLYEQTKEFYDGRTVVAIQLENEYNGNIAHIKELRKIAEEIGFKVPFFTMTAWPTNTPDKTLMPMFGGYPEAPWTQNKRPLKPDRRFAICEGRTEQEIGADIIGKSINKKNDFSDYPYAGCEVGTGNQVTQHRRPIIDDNDGYGVAFAKFASGMNWIGYYMYHGGRNPSDHLYQESRLSLYPNNYPIIDYDFQAPLSKDGEKRKSFDRLRLLHYFIKYFDKNIAKKQAYFDRAEKQYPYISIRSDKNLRGYVFISNYERGEKNLKEEILDIEISNNEGKKIMIGHIEVLKNSMYFFPFGIETDNVKIDYILAQPIAKIKDIWYFCECEGIRPVLSVNGKETAIDKELRIGNITIKVLDYNEALKMYICDDKVLFGQEIIYKEDNKILCEEKKKVKAHNFVLTKCKKIKLPYGYYLYSYSNRYYYKLKLDRNLINSNFDTVLKFKFKGLNLQVFAGDKLIDDYFNTDGYYTLNIRQIARAIGENEYLTIKAVGASCGIGNVYSEIAIPKNKTELTLEEVGVINIRKIDNC